jgi:phytoene dehydrogenase-like protein
LRRTRREFLTDSALFGGAALAGTAFGPAARGRAIEGSFVDDNSTNGHLIRDRASFPAASRVEKHGIVIVGGGIAGLSAAWRLQKRGVSDFVLLEMNAQPGGNSRWGENAITAYPWAAHYVPVPGPKAVYVRELFEDLGVLKDGVWDERYLCQDPQERLFLFGRWQEGIEPSVGVGQKDADQFRRLQDLFAEFRAGGGFTVPMELGLSRNTEALDRLSFADWLRERGIDSRPILWYLDYACRDDYGARAADTSAWAGIHYFASRDSEEKGPLTWPEGNGWIVRRLLDRLGKYVRTGQMVHRIETRKVGVSVYAGPTEYRADVAIFAAPTFLAPFLVDGMAPLHDFEYSPWLTANLTIERLPRTRGQAPPAWDTVVMDSPTLGYVDAMHQTLRTRVDQTVWTFYYALADGAPADNRRMLLQRSAEEWKEAILRDLERVHPDVRECVSRIDMMRMGHAMARPKVGAIFSAERRRIARQEGRLLFANSDLSGFSIFEEAQYRGVRAADRALQM